MNVAKKGTFTAKKRKTHCEQTVKSRYNRKMSAYRTILCQKTVQSSAGQPHIPVVHSLQDEFHIYRVLAETDTVCRFLAISHVRSWMSRLDIGLTNPCRCSVFRKFAVFNACVRGIRAEFDRYRYIFQENRKSTHPFTRTLSYTRPD